MAIAIYKIITNNNLKVVKIPKFINVNCLQSIISKITHDNCEQICIKKIQKQRKIKKFIKLIFFAGVIILIGITNGHQDSPTKTNITKI